MSKKLILPVSFDEALSSLLQVKPPAREKPAEKGKKRPTKKAAKKR